MSLRFSTENPERVIGSTGHASLHVDAIDTAIAVGSGDMPVLGTPRMIALIEAAACEALRGHLSSEQTSVGTAVQVSHRRPSPVGAHVVARAVIVDVDGNRITYDVEAFHEDEPDFIIGRGTHTRVVVDRDAFMHQMDR